MSVDLEAVEAAHLGCERPTTPCLSLPVADRCARCAVRALAAEVRGLRAEVERKDAALLVAADALAERGELRSAAWGEAHPLSSNRHESDPFMEQMERAEDMARAAFAARARGEAPPAPPNPWIEPLPEVVQELAPILREITAERLRQAEKWGAVQRLPYLPADYRLLLSELQGIEALARAGLDSGRGSWMEVLLEEVAEAGLAITDEDRKKELVQVATVAAQIVARIEGGQVP